MSYAPNGSPSACAPDRPPTLPPRPPAASSPSFGCSAIKAGQLAASYFHVVETGYDGNDNPFDTDHALPRINSHQHDRTSHDNGIGGAEDNAHGTGVTDMLDLMDYNGGRSYVHQASSVEDIRQALEDIQRYHSTAGVIDQGVVTTRHEVVCKGWIDDILRDLALNQRTYVVTPWATLARATPSPIPRPPRSPSAEAAPSMATPGARPPAPSMVGSLWTELLPLAVRLPCGNWAARYYLRHTSTWVPFKTWDSTNRCWEGRLPPRVRLRGSRWAQREPPASSMSGDVANH